MGEDPRKTVMEIDSLVNHLILGKVKEFFKVKICYYIPIRNNKEESMGKQMEISKTVYEICTENPSIIGIMKDLGFVDITNPKMLSTAGRFMTIAEGAAMKKIPIDKNCN